MIETESQKRTNRSDFANVIRMHIASEQVETGEIDREHERRTQKQRVGAKQQVN